MTWDILIINFNHQKIVTISQHYTQVFHLIIDRWKYKEIKSIKGEAIG